MLLYGKKDTADFGELGIKIPYYPAVLSRRSKLSSDNVNWNSCIQIIFTSREVVFPHFSAISPWTFHYNVRSNKELHFIVEHVQEKLFFSNVGRKNSFILPRIIVSILKHATHAITFTFNSLAVYCSSIVPRSIDTLH